MYRYGRFFVVASLQVFPASITPSLPFTSRRTKPPRFLFLSGGAAGGFVLPLKARPSHGTILTSPCVTREGCRM
jgi:hypothetical protein